MIDGGSIFVLRNTKPRNVGDTKHRCLVRLDGLSIRLPKTAVLIEQNGIIQGECICQIVTLLKFLRSFLQNKISTKLKKDKGL